MLGVFVGAASYLRLFFFVCVLWVVLGALSLGDLAPGALLRSEIRQYGSLYGTDGAAFAAAVLGFFKDQPFLTGLVSAVGLDDKVLLACTRLAAPWYFYWLKLGICALCVYAAVRAWFARVRSAQRHALTPAVVLGFVHAALWFTLPLTALQCFTALPALGLCHFAAICMVAAGRMALRMPAQT